MNWIIFLKLCAGIWGILCFISWGINFYIKIKNYKFGDYEDYK